LPADLPLPLLSQSQQLRAGNVSDLVLHFTHENHHTI
jgi:hypothetical protein